MVLLMKDNGFCRSSRIGFLWVIRRLMISQGNKDDRNQANGLLTDLYLEM